MTTNIQVEVYAEFNHEFGLPQYETEGAAGMDVRANMATVIRPGETKVVPTGLYVAIPRGFEIQVRPRSGLSLKTKLRIPNTPGTIDSDYRNEIGIICENVGSDDIKFAMGDRIAQLVLQRVPLIGWARVASKGDLGKTTRIGGFGSTGGFDLRACAGPSDSLGSAHVPAYLKSLDAEVPGLGVKVAPRGRLTQLDLNLEEEHRPC